MFRRRHAVPVCLTAALLLPELFGQISGAVPHPHNLLLITLDTMRADRLRIHRRRYPALDRIAAEGLAAVAGGDGLYALYGVAGSMRVSVKRSGYVENTQ